MSPVPAYVCSAHVDNVRTYIWFMKLYYIFLVYACIVVLTLLNNGNLPFTVEEFSLWVEPPLFCLLWPWSEHFFAVAWNSPTYSPSETQLFPYTASMWSCCPYPWMSKRRSVSSLLISKYPLPITIDAHIASLLRFLFTFMINISSSLGVKDQGGVV